LIRQIAALHVVIEPHMRIWFDYVDKPVSAFDEHERLIAALRTGDVAHAESVMRAHILETAPMLAEFASPGRR
jgi:DNA-binding GntR family transcriptional regulator